MSETQTKLLSTQPDISQSFLTLENRQVEQSRSECYPKAVEQLRVYLADFADEVGLHALVSQKEDYSPLYDVLTQFLIRTVCRQATQVEFFSFLDFELTQIASRRKKTSLQPLELPKNNISVSKITQKVVQQAGQISLVAGSRRHSNITTLTLKVREEMQRIQLEASKNTKKEKKRQTKPGEESLDDLLYYTFSIFSEAGVTHVLRGAFHVEAGQEYQACKARLQQLILAEYIAEVLGLKKKSQKVEIASVFTKYIKDKALQAQNTLTATGFEGRGILEAMSASVQEPVALSSVISNVFEKKRSKPDKTREKSTQFERTVQQLLARIIFSQTLLYSKVDPQLGVKITHHFSTFLSKRSEKEKYDVLRLLPSNIDQAYQALLELSKQEFAWSSLLQQTELSKHFSESQFREVLESVGKSPLNSCEILSSVQQFLESLLFEQVIKDENQTKIRSKITEFLESIPNIQVKLIAAVLLCCVLSVYGFENLLTEPEKSTLPESSVQTNQDVEFVTPVALESTPSIELYTVQPGDTLYSISRSFGFSEQEVATVAQMLAVANGISDPNLIVPGQQLYFDLNTITQMVSPELSTEDYSHPKPHIQESATFQRLSELSLTTRWYNGTSTSFTAPPEILWNAVVEASTRFQVDPLLLVAIAFTESGYATDKISTAGALGPFQFMPTTYPFYQQRVNHLAVVNGFEPIGEDPTEVRFAALAAAAMVDRLRSLHIKAGVFGQQPVHLDTLEQFTSWFAISRQFPGDQIWNNSPDHAEVVYELYQSLRVQVLS